MKFYKLVGASGMNDYVYPSIEEAIKHARTDQYVVGFEITESPYPATVWVNMYPGGMVEVYNSRKEALAEIKFGCIRNCVEVEGTI